MSGTSWKNRVVGAIATGAIVAGLFPMAALGEGGLVLDSTAAPDGPGYSLTVAGLETGDTAKYYQVIELDDDDPTATPPYIGTGQWKLTEAVDADGDGIVDGTKGNADFNAHTLPGPDGIMGNDDDETVNGLTVDDLVISSFTTNDDGSEVTSDTRQLTARDANAIAAAITNNKAVGTATAAASKADGAETASVTVDNAAAGMYMFVAVPAAGTTDYLYKPIFVSADYNNSVSKPEDNTHTITVETVEDGETIYADYADDNGTFKRSPLSIDKKSGIYDVEGNPIDLQQDIAVGDVVNFSITVPVPTYSENYVAPMFYITDTLTEGLILDPASISVEVNNGNQPVAVTEGQDYKVFVKGAETEGTDYFDFKGTVDASSTFDAFVVQFLNDKDDDAATKDGFLYTVTGAPTATITYQATVTETAKQKFAQQVTQMDNTAKLEYSKDPNYIPDGYFGEDGTPDEDFDTDNPDTTDESGNEEPTGELQDKTRHYTFDIDADVLGPDQSQPGPDGEEPKPDDDHDRTSEIRKIWLDANGEVKQVETTADIVNPAAAEDTGKTGEYGWLEGAEFTLTKIKNHVTSATADGNGKYTEAFEDCTETQMKFDAASHILSANGVNPKSDAKGYIAMKGLDAGVYILKEIKAPLGYSFNPNVQYQITIAPTYVMEPATPEEGTTPEDGKGGADDLILESYTVTIVTQKLDNNLKIVAEEQVTTISTYNMPNAVDEEGTDLGTPASILDADGSQITSVTVTTGSNETALVVNKRLGLLPATGGSGIYFYLVIGGVVAAIAVNFINKTKKQIAELK